MGLLKNYWLGTFLSLLAILCLVLYSIIGAELDENGILVEPFGLIPLFWLFLFLGVIAFAVTFLKSRLTQR